MNKQKQWDAIFTDTDCPSCNGSGFGDGEWLDNNTPGHCNFCLGRGKVIDDERYNQFILDWG